jgi:hypothetical protein
MLVDVRTLPTIAEKEIVEEYFDSVSSEEDWRNPGKKKAIP